MKMRHGQRLISPPEETGLYGARGNPVPSRSRSNNTLRALDRKTPLRQTFENRKPLLCRPFSEMAFITTFFRMARRAAAANRNGWALSSLLSCILVCTVSFTAVPVHAEPESSPREVVRIGFLAFDGETTYIDRNDEMLVVTERYL